MKNLLLLLLIPLTLVVAVYLVASHKSKRGITPGASTGVASKLDARSSRASSRDVARYEAIVAANPRDERARRSLAEALISRAETTKDLADFDRAYIELAHAESIAPGSGEVSALRVELLQSRSRLAQEPRKASYTPPTDARQNTSTGGVRNGVAVTPSDTP